MITQRRYTLSALLRLERRTKRRRWLRQLICLGIEGWALNGLGVCVGRGLLVYACQFKAKDGYRENETLTGTI